ncbi:thiaminase II [Bifidobacterium biavatii]|uniref:Aminopyrimidine aminohydrolase n=1 Tax=Bifidobacterium biavatii DSM 23969 TaxID=1437608 RepID=A0A087A4N6_9BIFI|nr:thiaminase II [Bifidobacterium biavatii]KFI53736.1 Transcriptional activator tenA [Bifidobacterium biavatii DSM 23969]
MAEDAIQFATTTTPATSAQSGFDAAAFGPITLDHLPPFAQRLRKAADVVWEEGYRQPFLRELGQGTLAQEKFAFYLLQDYRYLNDYGKVHALALTKTRDPEITAFMVNVQSAILNVETNVHRAYMASYGVTEEQMDHVRQSAFARAYTSNILSIAYGNPLVDVLVAVLPCAWVYADYGQRLAREFADTLEGNPYKSWVDMYKTDSFWEGSAWLIEHIERFAADLSEERKAELVDIFVTGVENEYMFWASAYDMQYTWKPEWPAHDALEA